jgi:hypothetical protein
VHWTPIIQESYYVVDLKEVDVAGVPIKYDPADMGQVIVDRYAAATHCPLGTHTGTS